MKKLFFPITFLLLTTACQKVPVKADFALAESQTRDMLSVMDDPTCVPRSVKPDGSVRCSPIEDWTSGFFAGTLWNLYEYTGDDFWKEQADRWTWGLEPLRHFTKHHDVGFMVGCSFGNGWRLTGDERYKEVIIDAANSLSTRFRPEVGLIQSWDAKHVPNAQYPVIIDNMMNLELLFLASELSWDKRFYEVAVSHADRTMENHFREDFSSYHVIDYDSISGAVRQKRTSQGYAHESAWSRGQAWGLYGFTMCYRYTNDPKYLAQAIGIADFILSHPNLPEDGVFYWDFDAPKIPDEPRDVSAAVIAASALLELSRYVKGDRYRDTAVQILQSLSAPPYVAEPGANGHFILTGSVGSFPAKSEVSVPLNYADYYFLEALNRYNK